MKKCLAIFLSALLICLLATTAFATDDTVFSDVTTEDWFFQDVMTAYENGWVSGTEQDTFSPDEPASRAMVVTMLHRMAETPDSTAQLPFTDVAPEDWFANGVAWAWENKIVTGSSETTFDPDSPITREQMVALLYRYANFLELDVSVGENTNILSYYDVFQVDEYAIPAMQWACGSGIFHGDTESTLNPDGQLTRSELATLLVRFAALLP